jgi:hypothetical protein
MLRISQDERITWREIFSHELFAKKTSLNVAECQ